MATLLDVAKKAGVSFMTVSRVINNKNNVREDTRNRVLAAIKELNYHPNSIGRGLISNKVQIIGFLAPNMHTTIHESTFYSEIMMGVEQACIEHDYNMLISTDKGKHRDFDYIRLFHERFIDGMVILLPDKTHPHIQIIENENIPCIVVGEQMENSNISYIDADNKGGAFKAVEFLIGKKHRDIGFLIGQPDSRNAIDRYQGYKEAMLKHQLPLNEDWIIQGDFSYHSGRECGIKLLKSKKLPTAVFSSNDNMALGFMSELKSRGIKIPDDISVIGFDGTPAARHYQPKLTTIRQPMVEMGYTAAQMLLHRIQSRQTDQKKEIFPVVLYPGDTVRELE